MNNVVAIDWSKAPEWANYVAEDVSGVWFWHADMPIWSDYRGEWRSEGQVQSFFSGNSRDSLQERPR